MYDKFMANNIIIEFFESLPPPPKKKIIKFLLQVSVVDPLSDVHTQKIQQQQLLSDTTHMHGPMLTTLVIFQTNGTAFWI